MARKRDIDNFLDGLEIAAGIAAIAAVGLRKTHDLVSQFDWDDEEEEAAIAPQPQPVKQLPARRRRKSNG